jgi:hypothetical protein
MYNRFIMLVIGYCASMIVLPWVAVKDKLFVKTFTGMLLLLYHVEPIWPIALIF